MYEEPGVIVLVAEAHGCSQIRVVNPPSAGYLTIPSDLPVKLPLSRTINASLYHLETQCDGCLYSFNRKVRVSCLLQGVLS
jgi:hypothetical protein